MLTKHMRAVGFLAVSSLAVLAACGDDSAGDAEPTDDAAETDAGLESDGTRTVTDNRGEVEVPVDPEAVAVLWRPTLASVALLDVEPVAAPGDAEADDAGLSPFAPEGFAVDGLDIVASPRDVNLEALALSDPDLIIAVDLPFLTDVESELNNIAPTVFLAWDGTASWRGHLDEVADVLGLEDRAAEVMADYDERVDEVRNTVTATAGDVGDIELSLVRVQAADVLRLETPLSFPGQVIDDVGFGRPDGQLNPDEESDFIEISLERIPDAEGDLVIVMANQDNTAASNAIQSSPLWQALDAAGDDRVIDVDYEWWGASNVVAAHRILDDLEAALG